MLCRQIDDIKRANKLLANDSIHMRKVLIIPPPHEYQSTTTGTLRKKESLLACRKKFFSFSFSPFSPFCFQVRQQQQSQPEEAMASLRKQQQQVNNGSTTARPPGSAAPKSTATPDPLRSLFNTLPSWLRRTTTSPSSGTASLSL